MYKQIFNRNMTVIFLCLIAIPRLIAMWFIPLTDTTEARYSEIARKMVETNDWITLWHDYGVPFWGKPPLSTWFSALSMKVFGINEFAVRLPSLVLAIAVLLLIWRFTRTMKDEATRWIVMIVLSSMALFYVAAGMVETDMSLLFSCTLVFTSFWLAISENNRFWGYMLFVGLGFCMLAKGPAAAVLALLPIFFWLLLTKNWTLLKSNLPWLRGSIITLAIFLPWYIMAEIKTPGFLDYFIVGEHINRFMVPGWHGDLYGRAHQYALGTVWLFLLVDALPWIFLAIGWTVYRKFKLAIPRASLTAQQIYLWSAFLTPLAFFTLAHNIIITYTLTGLPALAILISQTITPIAVNKEKIQRWVYVLGLFSPLVLSTLIIATVIHPDMNKKSAREITRLFQTVSGTDTQNLNYVGNRSFSMDFYNKGKAKNFASINEALSTILPCNTAFISLTNKQVKAAPAEQLARLQLVTSSDEFELFKASSDSSECNKIAQ